MQIVYSEDEEVTCTDFTNDFYKLVNIRSNSSRSLFSYLEGDTDDEDEDGEEDENEEEEEDEEDGQDSSMSESQTKGRLSPTPSEAGRAQLTSCSSSETDEHSVPMLKQPQEQQYREQEEDHDYAVIEECRRRVSDIEVEDVPLIQAAPPLNEQQCIAQIIKTELRRPPHVLVKSKSVLEDQEPSCILRHNQRRELESSVVRSDSISCSLMSKLAKETPPTPAVVSKLKERLLHRHAPPPPANSWRRSNGWKRVKSPVTVPMAVAMPVPVTVPVTVQSPLVSPKKVNNKTRIQLETLNKFISIKLRRSHLN